MQTWILIWLVLILLYMWLIASSEALMWKVIAKSRLESAECWEETAKELQAILEKKGRTK